MYSDKKHIIKDKKLPLSIRNVARMYPSNQVNRQFYGGLPHLGNALWGSWHSNEIQEAADAYDDYSLSDNLLIHGFKRPTVDKIRLGGGSPARFEPYSNCVRNIKKALKTKILSDYPLAAGDDSDKANIVEYFKNRCEDTIKEGNIIFTHSSTQGFTLVMEAILDYGDVVLITAPNYGLFSFIPERVGGRVRLLELKSKDDWLINPQELKSKINKINNELKVDYDRNRGKYIFRRSDTPPHVAAFVNINPHNPTGKVYGINEKALLYEIANICKTQGVFVIDDLAYKGLEFNRSNEALPICSLKGQFDNTISLYTLSKGYGLAGIRSGMIVGNEIVISLVRDKIFQLSDSLSIIQSSAMSAAFDASDKAVTEREEYFSYITQNYYKRFIFVKAIIEGIEKLKEAEFNLLKDVIKQNNIRVDLKKYFGGIDNIEIIMEPESGFFVLLDLSHLIGKSYKGFRVIDDETLLQFLYTANNIKVLPGKAFCWPNPHQLVIRVTIALDYNDLLKSFIRLKKTVECLK